MYVAVMLHMVHLCVYIIIISMQLIPVYFGSQAYNIDNSQSETSFPCSIPSVLGTKLLVYRTQMEPEFVYLSSAAIPPLTDSNYEKELEELKETSPKGYFCAKAEETLRNSGLAYTIIRLGGFNKAPGGVQAIQIKQDPENIGKIAHADAAEIVVQCLLDPRARNVAFYASTSQFAPSASEPDQKMSNLFGRMQPNT
ncbi:unnamed protein product [Choristocarpus tenellus]